MRPVRCVRLDGLACMGGFSFGEKKMIGRLFAVKIRCVAVTGIVTALIIPLICAPLAGWAQAPSGDLKVEIVLGIGHSSSVHLLRPFRRTGASWLPVGTTER